MGNITFHHCSYHIEEVSWYTHLKVKTQILVMFGIDVLVEVFMLTAPIIIAHRTLSNVLMSCDIGINGYSSCCLSRV